MFKRNKNCTIFVEIDKVMVLSERLTRRLTINVNNIQKIEPLMHDYLEDVCCNLTLIDGDKIVINESYHHFIKRLGDTVKKL